MRSATVAGAKMMTGLHDQTAICLGRRINADLERHRYKLLFGNGLWLGAEGPASVL